METIKLKKGELQQLQNLGRGRWVFSWICNAIYRRFRIVESNKRIGF